jgi:hypothetical protein
LYEEFTRINCAFQNSHLQYAALKGFALIPDYCSDPSLRCQFDFDFLIHPSDACNCTKALRFLGYQLTHAGESDWELKAGTDRLPSVHDLYKVKPQQSVELHFGIGHSRPASALSGDLLNRLRHRSLHGITFPSLSPADMFLGQAFHLFRHIGSEWTRFSWLLEYRNFVRAHHEDHALWNEVHLRAADMQDSALAVGTATLLSSMAFGKFAPPALTGWTVRTLSEPVRIWIERYGWDVLLADFPGTKLYLLLQRELMSDERAWTQTRRARLLPLHRSPRVVHPSDNAKGLRPRTLVTQLKFSAFRLRFHLIEGLRYMVESRRWKRIRNAASLSWLDNRSLH